MKYKHYLNNGPMPVMPLLALLVFLCATPHAHANQTDAQKIMDQTITVETNAQERQAQWVSKRAAILDEIRQLKNENLWLSFQEKKYSRYVSAMEGKIEELQRIKTELERLEQDLEPLLYELVDKFTKQVFNDLPFLKDERNRRITFLNKTLDDHTLSNGEKLRRVLEAMEVETAYGRSTELFETRVQLDGEETEVTVLRAGRLGLYCLTPNRATAGKYDPQTKEYVTIQSDFVQPLIQLETMIKHKRFTNFVFLPVKETR
ncbi:DUF3450 domain-containing protein [Pseudodesulfovibrio sediminis]|uniref:DUF3450 family protein n=1 Tax=Pseudodesulfovibrio sediminis TaxID=2810563 RepID=A0ABM7P5Q1_9BACT|nr:DUF3450 domain-containing protein [Pseudodesulfovibrio sediminis]BCS88142.1 hypothetical protein PSDVSF_13840 [Pseudodesulfovibrio sediminis]